MKLLLMLVMCILCLVMVFVGSRDAAQMKEDYDKYGGDALIKAISEYNAKNSSMKGYIGEEGVTRTPLNNDPTINQGKNKTAYPAPYKGQQVYPPAYNTTTTKQRPERFPYHPDYENQPNPYGAVMPSSSPSSSQPRKKQDDYYPPPPLQEQSPSQLQGGYEPRSENDSFIIPMNIPPQGWSKESRMLRSGQKIAYSGTTIYTFDKNGKPIPMPDGVYYDARNFRIHVKNSRVMLDY